VSQETEQGYLQPPDDVSAVYPIQASGSLSVSATWPTTTLLSLSVTCPDATQSDSGSAAVAITLPLANGDCQATLSEPSTEDATVAYVVTIGAADEH